MLAELEKRFKKILDPTLEQKLAEITNGADIEFPRLFCPSKNDCNSYKWFAK